MKKIEDIKKLRNKKKRGLSYAQIGKIEGVSRQAVHQLLTKKRHSVRKILDSLYWKVVDADGDYDGYLHFTSVIDGSGLRVSINEIFDALASREIFINRPETEYDTD